LTQGLGDYRLPVIEEFIYDATLTASLRTINGYESTVFDHWVFGTNPNNTAVDGKISIVSGMKFNDKAERFFPAVDYRQNDASCTLTPILYWYGSIGYYWSGRYMDNKGGLRYIASVEIGEDSWSVDHGLSVRCVLQEE
jgi:hypothetical protein